MVAMLDPRYDTVTQLSIGDEKCPTVIQIVPGNEVGWERKKAELK